MKSAKKCVTTYLPNESALKMDGAQACYLYPAAAGRCDASASRRA